MTHLYALPVAILLVASGSLFEFAGTPFAGRMQLLVLMSSAVFAVVLFAPIHTSTGNWRRTLVVPASVTLLSLLVWLVPGNAPVDLELIARTAAVLFLILTVTTSILQISQKYSAGNRAFLAIVLAALFMAPVWLAPLAELYAEASWLPDAIVALSPLSAMASALDFDLLRTPWFYEHSVLGSMRYDYPTWTESLSLLLVVSASLLALQSCYFTKRAKSS